jgi:P27 family predicted phage terminase small subunit
MTGPPKKPTKLKLLEGTYRKSRAVNNEANPEAATPIVPDHLSAEAKAEWGRVCSELEALGLLARIDRAALAAYCHCWADWVEASAMCATGPGGQDRKVIKTVAGNFMENPYYSIVKRSLELMHKFLTEFGMTPASRTRINAEPVSDKPKSGWGTFGK